MHYLFSPFALINQYQPFYAFSPQNLVETKAYYVQDRQFQKQITEQKQNTFQFERQDAERQDASKAVDLPIKSPKRPKKSKKKQDKNFGFREQDKERNIFSNILKGFVLALTQKGSMDLKVQKMLSESPVDMSLQQFFSKVAQIFSKCKSYFSPKSVRKILAKQEDEQEVRKVILKCLYNYLKLQFSLNLLVSNRIKRKSKLLQMKKSRELMTILRSSE